MLNQKSARRVGNLRPTIAAILLAAGTGLAASYPALAHEAFIPKLVNSSTIPLNGDLNPYGVAFVPEAFPGGGSIAPDVTNSISVYRLAADSGHED